MVWAKLDDDILDNEKIARVGVLGFAFHVAAITWCCRNLTDGFIPRARVSSLLSLGDIWGDTLRITDHVPAAGDCFLDAVLNLGTPSALRVAQLLVDAGLWIEDKSREGYMLHDFLKFNPTRAEVIEKREKERKKKADKRGQNGRRVSHGESLGESRPGPLGILPSPVPVPLSKSTNVDLGKPEPKRRAMACPTSEAEAGEVVAFAERWKCDATHAEWPKFLDFHRAKRSVFADWSAAWRNWVRRSAEFAASRPSGTYRSAQVTLQPTDPDAPWMNMENFGR